MAEEIKDLVVASEEKQDADSFVPSTQLLELAIYNAKKRELEHRAALMKEVITLSIKQTNNQDWVDMQGKPYLQSSGAEKVARVFGISWKMEGMPVKETTQDENGPYYIYKCKGIFYLGNKSVEVIGTCSQKDKFFGRDKNSATGFKSAAEIDETNIMKKAQSNMIAKGVTTILGIRNLTWDEVRQAGVSTDNVAKVTYATGGAGGGKISDAQAKRLYALAKEAGVSNEIASDYLKRNFKVTNSKDINRKDYETICQWVQEYPKNNPPTGATTPDDADIPFGE